MGKITTYTVITGDKDEVRKKEGITYFINAYDKFKDDRRNSRIQKMLPHLYFNSEYSIYLDGNIELLVTPEELIEKHLKDYDIALFKHPTRDCLYDEAITCARLRLDDAETIIEQVKAYEDSGYQKHKGLVECGIIIRRHTQKVKELNECWFAHYCRYSRRDQISFMKCADEVGIPIKVIDDPFMVLPNGDAIKKDGSFKITYHKHYV